MMTSKTYNLLIIDDDPNIAKLIKFYLKESNFIIETASDGRKGMQSAKNGNYDLLLLDMQMPHMDGLTFLNTISDLPGFDTLIIVVTAHDPNANMMSLIEKHAFDYIQKPFTANRLRLTIHNALKHRALQMKYTELIESVIKG